MATAISVPGNGVRSIERQRRIAKAVGNGVLVVMLVWTLVPFYWMVATSLKRDKEIYGFEATLVPRHPTLEAYGRLFSQTPFAKYLRNSAIVSVATTLVSLALGSLGAYAIARLRFPGRNVIARGLIFTYLVPPSLLFIPLFAVLSTLALIDTRSGLTLTYLSFTVPFSTWLLLGYFRSVPLELEEAALVDGCSRLSALVRVILPMSLPALAVVAFFSFTQAWNEFLYANVFVNSVEVRTITTGLTLFIVEDVFFWGPMMAAACLATIPPLVLYLIFQRWVVKGLTLGAVKG
jgi:ABC-type glycerol-3-phosphate transport system permease component